MGGGQNCYVVWNWSSAFNIGMELYAVHRENIINKTGHSLLESFSESCIGVSHSTQHFIKIVTKLSQRSPDDIHVLRREKNKLVSFLVQIKKRFPSPFHGASRAVSMGPVYFIRERELDGAINLSSCWRAGQTICAPKLPTTQRWRKQNSQRRSNRKSRSYAGLWHQRPNS